MVISRRYERDQAKDLSSQEQPRVAVSEFGRGPQLAIRRGLRLAALSRSRGAQFFKRISTSAHSTCGAVRPRRPLRGSFRPRTRSRRTRSISAGCPRREADDFGRLFDIAANHPPNERHRASHWQAKLGVGKRWKRRFYRTILPFATETVNRRPTWTPHRLWFKPLYWRRNQGFLADLIGVHL
jgi:hypothetical protein